MTLRVDPGVRIASQAASSAAFVPFYFAFPRTPDADVVVEAVAAAPSHLLVLLEGGLQLGEVNEAAPVDINRSDGRPQVLPRDAYMQACQHLLELVVGEVTVSLQVPEKRGRGGKGRRANE